MNTFDSSQEPMSDDEVSSLLRDFYASEMPADRLQPPTLGTRLAVERTATRRAKPNAAVMACISMSLALTAMVVLFPRSQTRVTDSEDGGAISAAQGVPESSMIDSSVPVERSTPTLRTDAAGEHPNSDTAIHIGVPELTIELLPSDDRERSDTADKPSDSPAP